MEKQIIPNGDAACLEYLENLLTCLSGRPAAYGVSDADVQNLARVVADFAAARRVTTTKATRTTDTILARRQSKSVARDLALTFVRQIKANEGVSDVDKDSAGVPLPRVGRPAPLPPPSVQVGLDIVGSVTGSMTVRFYNAAEPTRRSRPYGVQGVNLYRVIADAPVTSPEGCVQVGGYTRGPVGVPFEPEHNGKTVTFFACYISPRLEAGPMSDPVSMTIAA